MAEPEISYASQSTGNGFKADIKIKIDGSPEERAQQLEEIMAKFATPNVQVETRYTSSHPASWYRENEEYERMWRRRARHFQLTHP